MPTLPLKYPASRTVDASDTYFGVKVDDPYRWLEASPSQSPEVKAWLDAQNKLTRSYLDALPGRVALAKRFSQLLRIDTISAPGRAGDRYFYSKRKAEQEKDVLYWRSAVDPNDPEHVLIDPNLWVGANNASLGTTSATLDGKLMAYSIKPNNADEATLYVKDVASGQDLPGEKIEGAKYAEPSWLPDGSGFVYTWLPPADPAHVADRPGLQVVKFHKLGTDPKNDPILHDKTGDPTKFIGAYVSRDGKWLFFSQSNGWDKNDLWYQPLHGEPTAALAHTWKPIVVGKPFLYSLEAWHGQGYIQTNEGAPHFRLYKVSLDNPTPKHWKEIVPESPTAVLQGAGVIGNHLVLDWLDNVVSKIDICDLDGKLVRHLELPGIGSAGVEGDPDYNDLFFGFENFTTPLKIYQTSVTDPSQKIWAEIKFPVDPSPYTVEQQWFTSKDGTKVPMFIVHRKDIKMDGSTPFMIYGYGGFSVSQTPVFAAGWFPFLEAGGGYAMVNLRGGGEFGEQWHQDGMLLKKQHVFDDCIAAAEYLIKNQYTSPEHLAVRGGSNGGLLVGAVITQRPDLFRAAVCQVPLLDMIRYPLFGSGKTWIPEYGSPDNAEQFKALYAYSPYHHIQPGVKYPALLMMSADSDDRVDPMHARKFVAKMQADNGDDYPILLRVETQSGHGGSDEVKKTIEEGTDIWSFLIHELGATPPSDSPQDTNSK
ncbi:MAG TPA: prolyl oligopeptidase family serine peptidase [Candidatus Methylacidiphilales bacterium]|nr:prolyl oligopeptidase family serine peptidase [Candidatus Methylacidiphilales bacterium]